MLPPELLSQEEEKILAAIVEATIDFDIEQKHIHEVDAEPTDF